MSKSIRKLLIVAALGLSLALPGVALAASDLDINPMPPTFKPFWQPVPNSPGVEFAANLPTDIFRYQDKYYFYWEKRLYQSSKPSGPWKSVAQEPSWFTGIDKSHFKMLEKKPKPPPYGGARPLPPKPKPPAAGRPMAAPPRVNQPAAAPPTATRRPAPSMTPGRPPVAAPPKPPTPPAPAAVSRPVTPPAPPAAPQPQTLKQAPPPAQAPPAAALSTGPAKPGPAPVKKEAPAEPSGRPKLPKAM